MLATFIQQVINGLMLGGSYALVAIGYTLILGCSICCIWRTGKWP